MKTYQQYCGLAKALDLVGERWTLLMVREFLLGPRRYGQLLQELEGITTNLLAQRLKQMKELGLIEKIQTPNGTAYQLTQIGAQLERPIMELARWGSQFLAEELQPDDTRKLSWALLSSKRRYQGGEQLRAQINCLAAGTPPSVSLHGETRVFSLVFSDTLTVREQPDSCPDLTLTGNQDAFFLLLYGRPSIHKVAASGHGLEVLARAWQIPDISQRVLQL